MKIASIQIIDGKEQVRVPAVTGMKYTPKTMFLAFEVSNKLNDSLRGIEWLDITVFKADELEEIINHGYDFAGKSWKQIFSFWRDLKGKAIMVPEDSAINNIADIGCFTHMEVMDDALKAGKYINRHFAPLQMGEDYVKGMVVEVGETKPDGSFEVVYELPSLAEGQPGDWIVVRYNNLKVMSESQVRFSDGHLDYSQRYIDVLAKYGSTVKHGQSLTIASKFGMGKGHGRLVVGLEPDLVIHGPKTSYAVEFRPDIPGSADIELGVRTDLHIPSPHTDMFSNFNYQFDRDFMLPKHTRGYLQYVFECAHNEILLKKAFLSNTAVPSDFWSDGDVNEVINRANDQETAWSLQRYLQRAASPFCMPWMYRKVVAHLMTKVLQAERGRVPLDYAPGRGVAISRYAAGDIFAIQPNGSVDTSKAIIPEGFCVCMDLPAGIKIVFTRQPTEHQNAHVILTNMHHPAYEFAKGGVYVYLGHSLIAMAPRLGGMDLDDALLMFHDSEWVRGFEELSANPYPEYGPLVDEDTAHDLALEDVYNGDDLSFYDKLMGLGVIEGADIAQYSDRHALYQIERAKTSGAGIGPVANAILLDAGVSIPRYKAFIARQLAKMPDALDDLVNKEDFQMRKFATYLEKVIDAAVKDRAELEGLGDITKQINEFHVKARFYPRCLEGKIPQKKLDKGDFLLVDTSMCVALEGIKEDIAQLMEAFKTNEWLLMRSADREVLAAFPSTHEVRMIVHGEPRKAGVEVEDLEPGLLTIWRREWNNAFEKYGDRLPATEYPRIVNMVLDFAKPYEFMMKEIAVELYRSYYKGKKAQAATDQYGRRRSVSDGLLGINYFANHLLDALDEIGFTGDTYAVDFDKYASHMSRIQVNVKVNNGVVYQAKTMKAIGFCFRCPNGDYPMIAGLITSREAHDCLQAPEAYHDLPKDIDTASIM